MNTLNFTVWHSRTEMMLGRSGRDNCSLSATYSIDVFTSYCIYCNLFEIGSSRCAIQTRTFVSTCAESMVVRVVVV